MNKKIYQLKISLKGVQPSVWRRILIEDSATFFRLQKAIDTAFGWSLSKHSTFKVRGVAVCQRQDKIDVLKECLSSVTTKLSVFNLEPGEKIDMKQDLYDEWMFSIEVEAYVAPDIQNAYPICVECHGKTPPKELGSAKNFVIYQDAVKNERHAAHTFYRDQFKGYEKIPVQTTKDINIKMKAI